MLLSSFMGVHRNGYYNERGEWRNTKHCFVACARCDCGPPGGVYYSAAFDKRLDVVAMDPPLVEDRDA